MVDNDMVDKTVGEKNISSLKSSMKEFPII